MTLEIAHPSNDDSMEKSENDECFSPVSYPEPFQQPSLPYVQLCICKNDDDPDAFDQHVVFPILLQRSDFAETIEEYPPAFDLPLEDESRIENRNIDQFLVSNGLSDQYRTIYEVMEHLTTSFSESSSISSSEEEEEEREILSPDCCSGSGETLSTTGTVDLWWDFDTVEWRPSFQHVTKANDHHFHDKICTNDREAESSTVWFVGVPCINDFGTNAVLLDQYGDFSDFCDKVDADGTCAQWLQRILILPQKRDSKCIRRHKKLSSCVEHPPKCNSTSTLPQRKYRYSVLR